MLASCLEVQGACRAGKMGNCIGDGKMGETQQEHRSEKTVGGAVAATILAYQPRGFLWWGGG